MRLSIRRAFLALMLAAAIPSPAALAGQVAKPSSGAPPAKGEPSPGIPDWKQPPAYSVDMVLTGDGKQVILRRCLDSGKARTEISGEGEQIIITERPDKKIAYLIVPSLKTVMEQSLDPPKEQSAGEADKSYRVERLGTEDLEGRACDKFKVEGGGSVAYFWADRTTHAPVRIKDATALLDWKNYHVGPQPAALFEPPADYQTLEMPDLEQILGQGVVQMAMAQAGGMASQFGDSALGNVGFAAGGPLGMLLGRQLGGFITGKIFNLGRKALAPDPTPRQP